MGKFHPPMFCDNCSYLAMAVLEGAPLCMGCLMEELKSSSNPSLVNEVKPLDLDPIDFKEASRNPRLPKSRFMPLDAQPSSKTAH